MILVIGYIGKGIWISSYLRPVYRQCLYDNVRAVKQHGFTTVYLNQFINLLFKEKKVIPWPGKINSSTQEITLRNKNKKNVIVLQVESLDSKIIDYRVGPKYVMPYLHLLKEQSMFFKHYFSQKRGGASSDAELSNLTSLIPLNTHSGFITADYRKITPLSKVLAREGYYCVGIHANSGDFF